MTVEAAGRRVEEVLDRLAAAGDPAAASAAEELVRALMDLYGEGLARIVALLSADGGAALEPLLTDEVSAALLVLHDLHPHDLATRVGHGLRRAGASTSGGRGGAGGSGAEIVELDPGSGRLRVALAGAGCGCPSTAQAARERIEAAMACFAPEVTSVVVESAGAADEPVLLQIGAPPAVAR
jgi:hypothetical protein